MGYASKRTLGLLQESVTISQNQLTKWASWGSITQVTCLMWMVLSKHSFWKNCFFRNKKVPVLERGGQKSGCLPLPVTTSAWWLWLCPYLHPGITPAVSVGLCIFLRENLSSTQPAERYHLYLPLSPCCESPLNCQRTGWISPLDTTDGFGATTLSKDAFKEAQSGG